MLKALYWRLPKSKKLPSDQDKEALDLFLKSGQALTWVDSDRQFLIMPLFFRHINKFDLYKIPKLPEYLLDFSTTCSAHGIFWLSKRYIDISKRFIPEDEVATRIKRTLAQNFLLCYQADWKKITDFNHEILNDSLRIGDLLHAELLLWIECLVKGGQGQFKHLMKLVDKSYEIGDIYAYDQSIIHARLHKVDYLVNTRQLHEAISESQQGILFTREIGNEFNQIMFFGLKAEAQQLSGDPEGAHETIKQATELYEKQQIVLMPVFCAPYFTARFFVGVCQLQHAIRSKNTTDMANIRRHACKSGQAAVKMSRKYAPYRTKVMRLMGLYNWLIGKQRKALNWWDKAIQEGEHLDARPELSRTYFEVGKRLMEANSKYSSLNGIEAKAFLEKARMMFTDMDFQWDLEQLEKVISI
jgi:tetratricopeptide (TPR) repeat protein